ncbi:MAG TPA: hypothetical protein VG755_33955, partial [Nannocystaceae bacterium]|nr:hypothetical protein [Nannocystaceae bacterium]
EAQLAGVWDASRAAELTGGEAYAESFAADAMQRLVADLDGYRGEWIAAHHETCDAAQRRREISPEQMDLRMACLAERRTRLDALVDVLVRRDPEALAQAQEATAELPPIAACSDARYVGRQGYGDAPMDPKVAIADAQRTTGALEEARTNAIAALADAESGGDAIAMAHAGLALGRAQQSLFESHEAHATLVAAYEHARRQQLGDLAVAIAIELVGVSGADLSRTDEGLWWLRIAELDGAELGDAQLVARREQAAAEVLEAAGRGREALARATAAQELLRDASADAATLASATLQVGRLHLSTGELDRGTALLTDAARALADAVGPEHPGNAKAERLLADAAQLRGDVDAANRHAKRAVAVMENALGADHIALTPMLETFAEARHHAGASDEGIAIVERALVLARPRPQHDGVRARLHALIGDIVDEFDRTRAVAEREQAFELARAAFGDQHRVTVQDLAAYGDALGAAGRTAEGIEKIGVALVIGESVLGVEHPEIASIHASLALAYERE